MKFLQLIVLSALFAMILNCSGSNKDECHRGTSPAKTDKLDYRCCWFEAKYKENKDDSNWQTKTGCDDFPYDGDYLSAMVKLAEAERKFKGGDVDYYTIDCSSSWINSFFGLVLLLAFAI